MAVEACDNGLDDDGDGLHDCADPECDGQELPAGRPHLRRGRLRVPGTDGGRARGAPWLLAPLPARGAGAGHRAPRGRAGGGRRPRLARAARAPRWTSTSRRQGGISSRALAVGRAEASAVALATEACWCWAACARASARAQLRVARNGRRHTHRLLPRAHRPGRRRRPARRRRAAGRRRDWPPPRRATWSSATSRSASTRTPAPRRCSATWASPVPGRRAAGDLLPPRGRLPRLGRLHAHGRDWTLPAPSASGPSLPAALEGPAVVELTGGRALVLGGSEQVGASLVPSARAFLFETSGSVVRVRELLPMDTARASPRAARLGNGWVYVEDTSGAPAAWFDPASERFTPATPLPVRRNHTLAGGTGAEVYLAGGLRLRRRPRGLHPRARTALSLTLRTPRRSGVMRNVGFPGKAVDPRAWLFPRR